MRIPNLLEITTALAFENSEASPSSPAFTPWEEERLISEKYIKEHPEEIEALKRQGEELRTKPINILRFETYKQFDTTGSRNDYQDEYFAHRDRLSIMFMCAYLLGDEYLSDLENIIWAICDEYTWCLPAHLGGHSLDTLPEDQNSREVKGMIHDYPYSHKNTLDLFACETARELAEIIGMLGDRLSPLVRTRAVSEIIDRVFNQYLTFNSIHHFELSLSNWSAVCAGSLGVAAIYLIESNHQLAPVIQRVISALDVFLSSYGTDGIGCEGIGYWNYGFINLCKFADLLKKRTGGKLNLFLDSQVELVAAFPSQAFVYRDYCINFSDCKHRQNLPRELIAYLLKQYPDMNIPTSLAEPEQSPEISPEKTPVPTLRKIFWGTVSSDSVFRNRSDYFQAAQWLVSCTGTQTGTNNCCYSFIIKGGHNFEPHNHNDLGHFMLYADDEQLLSDLGGGEYTKEYFGAGRYSYLVNSSRGHSVPVIMGRHQEEGENFKSEVLYVQTKSNTDCIIMELKDAYLVHSLKSYLRRVDVTKGSKPYSITIHDSFQFTDDKSEVTERFVSIYKPVIKNNVVYISGARHCVALSCTNKDNQPYITEETYTKHDLEIGTAYLINFDFELSFSDSVCFNICPCENN